MKDLANERDAVVRKIREIDFEPVNAESWLPNGNKSWSKIQEEIDSSHIFVLILGERYGWIPRKGAGAAEGHSVTHMELTRARELGLPILPFIKKLSYDSERDSEDAKRRDVLRREVTDWDSGRFVAEFDLAYDLAIKVAASVVGVLVDSYLRSEVQRRAMVTRSYEDRLQLADRAVTIDIPHRLIKQVIDQEIILIVGAGVSLAAGYPSERALSEFLASQLGDFGDLSERPMSAIPFPLVAQLFQYYAGRHELIDTIQEVISGFPMVEPTQVHMQGVKLFRRIFTTSFDDLFETAYHKQGIDFEVIESGEVIPDTISSNLLVKLHGTITNPENLLITDRDIWRAYKGGTPFERSVSRSLHGSSTLILGLTLSDVYWYWITDQLDKNCTHYIVSPSVSRFDHYRYDRRRMFHIIEANPDDFVSALANEVERVRNKHP